MTIGNISREVRSVGGGGYSKYRAAPFTADKKNSKAHPGFMVSTHFVLLFSSFLGSRDSMQHMVYDRNISPFHSMPLQVGVSQG